MAAMRARVRVAPEPDSPVAHGHRGLSQLATFGLVFEPDSPSGTRPLGSQCGTGLLGA